MGNMRFKAGDRVRIKSLDWYNKNKTIHGDVWFDNAVFVGGQSLYCGCELTIRLFTDDHYYVIENDYYWTDEMIEGLVDEEEIEKKLSDESWRYKNIFDNSQYPQSFGCPEGYIFKDENGNVINAKKIVLEKKKKEYPKTFDKCCHIVQTAFVCDVRLHKGKYYDIFRALAKLIVCRDAYWKIAGEEMGLGKPWEPDWEDKIYYVYYERHRQYEIGIKKAYCHCGIRGNRMLVFPTEEMVNAFYENFKELIESCKELL